MPEPKNTGEQDSELARKAASGDESAFRSLIRQYQNIVFDLSYRLLGNRQDAEDNTQDTFIAFYRSLFSYRPEHKLSNWLYTIALNKCRNKLRKRKIIRFISFDWESSEETPPLEIPSAEPGPGESLETSENQRIAQRAVDALPDKLRAAFLLRHRNQLSYEEISEILGISLSAVKVRLHRAKTLLWKKFGEKR